MRPKRVANKSITGYLERDFRLQAGEQTFLSQEDFVHEMRPKLLLRAGRLTLKGEWPEVVASVWQYCVDSVVSIERLRKSSLPYPGGQFIGRPPSTCT